MTPCTCGKAWMTVGPIPQCPAHGPGYGTGMLENEAPREKARNKFFRDLMLSVAEADAMRPLPTDDNWMRVAPGTDAAIWRPWSRETGEL